MSVLAVACLATTCVGGLSAQSWAQVSGTAPLGRQRHALAHDPQLDRIVLFGGQANGNFLPPQTWDWNGSVWTQQAPANSPVPRQGLAMAFDGQRIVLFGGLDFTGVHNDTWQWLGGNWQLATPGVLPPPRYLHALALDPLRARVVLFGGFAGAPLADTWEWDGSQWLQVVTASAPAPRYDHALAFDPVQSRTVLFGGTDQSRQFGDTWEWNGSVWTQRFPASAPAARDSHAMATDGHRGIVLFGGYHLGELADTWTWNGSTWTLLATGSSPPAREGQAMAYDSRRGKVFLFGGAISGTALGDTWQLPITAVTAFGIGCGAPPISLAATAGSLPVLGSSFTSAIANVPANSTAAFIALGLSDQVVGSIALPLELSGFGLPGCWLYQDLLVPFLPCQLGAGVATHALVLPNQPALVGVVVFAQGSVAAGGVNTAGLLTSNALRLTLGF
ncbi:MAG TPA: hypothetical protein VK348_09030 [Planctomycetota bacterium]|nr:hypothetical protein [Planctomycetota bacterium]